MSDSPSYFEQAADALSAAMTATSVAEQELLLEKALRFNRLAMAAERAKRARRRSRPSASDPKRHVLAS